MNYDNIISQSQLVQFCRDLADADSICFDTEFVSEDTYRSELCLVQVAAGDRLAVIDPYPVGDMTPFWELIAAPGHETIVHAGREELVFALTTVGRPPANMFDVQIAAGLIGLEYPASYGNLMYRLVGESLKKGETRTDWRRRPLTRHQIEYALDDVRYLKAMRDKLHGQLQSLGRLPWMATEMKAWQDDVAASLSRERWRRVSGISGLNARALAIVREVWRWREDEAQHRDCPPKRVLRDDLIIELAKRRSTDPKQIRAVRGMERGDLQRALPRLAECVDHALKLPDSELPQNTRRETPAQLNMLGQFLSAALTSICRTAQIAPSIVGTANDVRDLIAFRMGYGDGETPALAEGWRAEVVGQLIDDLLAG
ncbi:MAG TPA: ribonuclease D, partial [Burkholderiaceae bacterium]|nr:ribonuclease D [Burkholderiaceae bacterium]